MTAQPGPGTVPSAPPPDAVPAVGGPDAGPAPDTAATGVPSGSPATPAGRHAARLPFWLLQVAELAATAALVDFSLHVDHAQVLVASAAAWAVLAVTAKGPLGLVRVCSRRLHRALVVVVGVALALSPLAPAARPDTQGIIIVVLVGVGLTRLATLTSVAPGAGSPARPAPPQTPAVTAQVTGGVPVSSTPTTSQVEGPVDAGRAERAGHLAGRASSRLGAAPRHAGRMAGRLRSAPRRAGRITGRLRAQRP